MNSQLFLKLTKFFLYLVPLSVIWVYQGTLFPFIVGKYIFFRTAVALAAIFFVWHWASGAAASARNNAEKNAEQRRNNIMRQPLVVAVAVFALIYIISGFLGYNPSASFWSNFERGEGGLQIIQLLIFFSLLILTFKDQESWRKMFIVSIGSAVLVILYGVAAAAGIGDFVGSGLCSRFAGALGNPAYLGTFLIFSIFYALYLGIQNLQTFKLLNFETLLWFGLAFIFAIFLLLSQTRGAVLGLGVGILAFLGYLLFTLPNKKHRWYILSLISILIILGTFAVKYRQSIDLMPFCKEGGNRILDISLGAETFQTRLLLWQESFEAFKERPILGWGPENFSAAFEKYYKPYFTTWYDRAHNIFFDYLVMTGALGLLSFIGIFVAYYWQFFKAGKQEIIPIANYQSLIARALFFSLPIAYLVQGLVLFDVLSIYINLFMFLAFAVYKFQK